MSIEIAFYVKTVIVFYKFQDFFFKQHSLMNQPCYDNLIRRFTERLRNVPRELERV